MNTTAQPLDKDAAPPEPYHYQDHAKWRADVDRRLDLGAEEMRTLSENLKANTEITNTVRDNTSEVVDLLRSFQGAFRVLNMLGKLAKPLGYIVAFVAAVYGLIAAVKGGVPPK